jgi:hypothetical protein
MSKTDRLRRFNTANGNREGAPIQIAAMGFDAIPATPDAGDWPRSSRNKHAATTIVQ